MERRKSNTRKKGRRNTMYDKRKGIDNTADKNIPKMI